MKFHTSTIALALLFGGFIWIADTVIDYFFFYDEPFWDLLIFQINPHELYIRIVFLLSFMIFALILSNALAKRNNLNIMLQENEDRFRTLFESANDAIFLMKDAKITLCNKATINIFGCNDKSEILDHFIWDFSPKLQPDGMLTKEKSVLLINKAFDEEAQKFYWQHNKKNGKIFDAEVTLSSFVLNGEQYLQAIVRDITIKKKYDDAIWAEKEKLRTTLDSIGDAVISTDDKGYVDNMNPVAESLTGWTIKEAKGMALDIVFNIVNSKTHFKAKNPVELVLKDGKTVGLANHTLLISRNGNENQIADSASPIRSENGDITGVVLVFRDVTDEYTSKQELKNSQELLNSVFNSIQDGISILNPDLSIRYVNEKMNQWYANKVPLIGKKCYYCYHDAKVSCDPCPSKRCMDTGKMESDIVIEHSDEGNHPRWIELYSYPIIDSKTKEITGVAEFVKDITSQVLAKEELKQSEENLRTTLYSIGDAVITTDTNGFVTNMNPVAEQLTGWDLDSAKALPLDKIFNIINAKTHERVNNPVEKVLENGKIVGLANHTMLISKEGYGYQISDSASPIRNNKGEITGVVLVFRDVTDDYAIQEQLKLNEMQLRQIIDLVPHFIFAKDKDGVFLIANKAIADFFNTPLNRIIGYSDADFNTDKKAVEYFINEDRKVIESGNRIVIKEEKIINSDGNTHYFQTTKIPFLTSDSEIPAVLGISIDITERKLNESKVLESENHLRQIIIGSPIPTFVINKDHVVTHWNEALSNITATVVKEMIGTKDQWKAFYDHQRPTMADLIVENTSGLDFEKYYKDIYRKSTFLDGAYEAEDFFPNLGEKGTWLFFTAAPILDNDGNIIGAIETLQDTTYRKTTENILVEKEERLRLALAGGNLGTWDWNTKTGSVVFDEGWANMLGYKLEELEPNVQTWEKLLHPDDKEYVMSVLEAHLQGKTDYYQTEHRVLTNNGSWKWILDRGEVTSRDKNGNPLRAVGTHLDINDRKELEFALKDNERRIKEIIASVPGAVYRFKLNKDGNAEMVFISDRAVELFERPLEELWDSERLFDDLNPVSKKIMWEAIILSASEMSTFDHQFIINPKNSKKKWIRAIANPSIQDDGSVIWNGVMADISAQKATEQAVTTERDKAQMYLDVAGVIMLALDSDGIVTLINQKGCEILEGTEDEIVGKNWFISFLPEYVRENTNMVFQTIMTGDVEMFKYHEQEILTLNNNLKMIAWHNTVLQDNDGNLIGTLSSGEDITIIRKEREELIASEERYRAVFNNSAIGIGVRDLNFNYTQYNEYYKNMLGYTDSELKDLKTTHITHPDDIHITTSNFNAIRDGKSRIRRYQKRYITKQGHIVWAEVSAQGLLDSQGKVFALLGVVNDINDRKLAEEALIKAKEKAEESDRLKSAFLANMSHEIRTPMNGILGFAGLLKEPENSQEEQLEYAGIIEKSGERMLNVLNDIIDIAKIEAGQVEVSYETFNLNEQINNLYDFFKFEADARGLTLSQSKGLSDNIALIRSDKTKLNVILTNLIKNAIKYTDEGSVVFGYDIKSRNLEFYVKDTGIGIPEDKLESIFDRFVQVEISTSRSYEGAGLGLSITKAYIKMLNGKIWVESLEGQGTNFLFTIEYLPAFNPEDKHQSETSFSYEKLNDKKVLIVDDDEPGMIYLTRILRNKCKELISASNGLEAIGIFKENPDFDLILMDIKMPILDGYETTRMIRDISKDVIIIAQTAFALKEEEQRAINAGFNDYITKPFKDSDLFRILKKYM